LRGGYRMPVGSLWYIEPYGRGGYPFVFGIGVMAGVRVGSYTVRSEELGVRN
jgi:hypothetical protein